MNTNIPIEIIKLEDKSYHIMIEVTINGTTKANLIIDTGASKSVFDKNFISDYAHNITEVDDNRSSGINAMINLAHIGYVNEFKIGELILPDFECLMLDLTHINDLYKNYADKFIAGLLGSDFLVAYNAVINYPLKKITLSSQYSNNNLS